MGVLSESDVIQFRREYYDLLVRLLAEEPDADMLSALRQGIDDRAVGAAQVHAAMGEGWRVIAGELERRTAEDLTDEFTRLFLGPYANVLSPYECRYLTERLYTAPLSDVRAFLSRHGLERTGAHHGEPEDALAFELSVMARLIERQQAGGDADPDSFLAAQREFLERHLMVWAPAFAADLVAHAEAVFYRGVGLVLQGFLEVERDFFVEDGGLHPESLEAAQRRHRAPIYRGPVFDAEAAAEGKGPRRKDD
jgi:TorA maturation chaperone TorD